MALEDLRFVSIELAWKMYGLPYIWGGNDAVQGFDCSGMQVEILQSVGMLPEGDWSAAMLWSLFAAKEVFKPEPGCLVFWENSQGHIRHVEMCIGDGLSIGASGGGRHVSTREAAILQNAFVKIRPIGGRGLVRGYLDPFKPEATP